jgi:UMF1 family MFS transporter
MVQKIPRPLWLNKTTFSWALYDWANSAFATTVMAGFFPIFFKSFWGGNLDPQTSTWILGLTHSSVGVVLAVIAPILGVLADQGKKKKFFLLCFATLGILASLTLSFIGAGQYQWAAIVFAFGSLGFAGSNVFYDSLITDVTSAKNYHAVSGFGYALGYLGGGLLFAFQVAMTLFPDKFGLESPQQAVSVSFAMVALWWFLFSIPLVRQVHENSGAASKLNLMRGWRELGATLKGLKSNSSLTLFFVAYLLYIDGVNTTIKMAVDYGMALGFSQSHLITALLMVQFVGFPAAIAFGWLGNRFGAKRGLYAALSVYIGVIIGAYFMTSVSHFYVMALAIGCVQGGVQSLSRSYYAMMIPTEKSGEYFGLFNMVGKFSSILGPVAVGWVGYATGSSRVSILVILLFFIFGGALLTRVHPDETNRA